MLPLCFCVSPSLQPALILFLSFSSPGSLLSFQIHCHCLTVYVTTQWEPWPRVGFPPPPWFKHHQFCIFWRELSCPSWLTRVPRPEAQEPATVHLLFVKPLFSGIRCQGSSSEYYRFCLGSPGSDIKNKKYIELTKTKVLNADKEARALYACVSWLRRSERAFLRAGL